MAKVIKNIDVVEHTYAGQTIAAGASYTIQLGEQFKWASSDTLLADITDGKAQVNDGVADISGTAAQINYLLENDVSAKDSEGAYVQRVKAAHTGWTYHLTAPEFKTSQLDSIHSKDVAGNNLNYCTIKCYDAQNVELTTQESCNTDSVKTTFTIEPPWDYEVIGGTIKTVNDVTENVRVWVIAVPDVPAEYGGSKVMVQGVNLRFIDPNNGIEVDGRTSKYMVYSATYHTNKLQLIVKHPAGHKEDIMIALELFKA
jgi:hypothetical protein